jgi:hypothetical protein
MMDRRTPVDVQDARLEWEIGRTPILLTLQTDAPLTMRGVSDDSATETSRAEDGRRAHTRADVGGSGLIATFTGCAVTQGRSRKFGGLPVLDRCFTSRAPGTAWRGSGWLTRLTPTAL